MSDSPLDPVDQTLTDDQVETLAKQLIDARLTRGAIRTDQRPRSFNDAYAVQRAVCSRMAPVGAWKTGRATGHSAPIYAPIFSNDMAQSPARFAAGRFRLIGIEVETGFRLGTDLPHRLGGYSHDELREAIDAMLPVIEVVDSRLEDPDTAGPVWKLADNQVNGGLVTGAPITDWRALDPDLQPARLLIDGAEKAHTSGSNPAGAPMELIYNLANHIGDHCGGLQAGQIIITGSLTGVIFVEAGCRVQAVFEKMGQVEIEFDA